MTTFDDRDKGFENKFVHNEELAFRVHARTNKLVGLWAATLMGKNEAEAETYAMRLTQDFGPDDAWLIDRLTHDFAKAGIDISNKEIRIEIARRAAIASSEIMGDQN